MQRASLVLRVNPSTRFFHDSLAFPTRLLRQTQTSEPSPPPRTPARSVSIPDGCHCAQARLTTPPDASRAQVACRSAPHLRGAAPSAGFEWRAPTLVDRMPLAVEVTPSTAPSARGCQRGSFAARLAHHLDDGIVSLACSRRMLQWRTMSQLASAEISAILGRSWRLAAALLSMAQAVIARVCKWTACSSRFMICVARV